MTVLAEAVRQASVLTEAETIFAILASAVLVLAGCAALVRAIWKVAQTLRDNTKATSDLSSKMSVVSAKLDNFAETMDGRVGALEGRVAALEHPPFPPENVTQVTPTGG